MTSGTGAGGAREVVRDGLRRVVGAAGLPPAAGPARVCWQNRLLDEVGSDRRGLVQLLLRLHDDGLVGEIPAGSLAPAAWGAVRARLAFGYAAATYLDGDMVRWAVDAWAYATGAIDERALYAPPAPAPVPVPLPPPAPRAMVPGRAPQPAQAGAAPAGRRPQKVPGRVRRAMARANAPPAPNPFPANFDRIAGSAFAVMFAISAAAMWVGIAERREAGGLEVRPGAPGVGASRLGPEGRALARLHGAEPLPPSTGAAHGRPLVMATLTPADAAGNARGAAPDAASSGDAVLVDSLRMRDGTVRTGHVERLTRDVIVLRDVWSDALDRVALDEVVEFRTRHGERVPVGGNDALTARDVFGRAAPRGAGPLRSSGAGESPSIGGVGAPEGAARTRGYAGRYTVRQQVLAVGGSESCGAVAAAVRGAAPTVETVAHVPGAATFALTSRPGVRGTVDADGRFRTEFVEGTRDGVRYQFRMTGQFTPGGFQAETESATDAVLKFGTVQRCRMSASLDGRRLP